MGRLSKRTVAIIIGVVMVIGVFLSIFLMQDQDTPDETGQDKEEHIVIGFCVDNLVIERWQRDQEILRAKAREKDIKVIVYNANEDNETQNSQIRQLIKDKVDAIIVVPYDKEGITESIQQAKKAGIKVIAYDRLIKNAPLDAYISFDNIKVGKLEAGAIKEVVPKGNYLIINGSPEDNNSSMFRKGYMEILDEPIKKGDIKIIGEIWATKWREEPAHEVVANILDRGESIDAIIAANDRLAEAAIRALAEKGQAGKVYVAGHDADISACQRIVEGTQYATVYKPIKVLATEAVEKTLDLIAGKKLETGENIANGYGDIPYVKLDVKLVTKDNLKETVIADGFHTEEAIYRR